MNMLCIWCSQPGVEVLTQVRRQVDMLLTVTACHCGPVKPADRLSLTSVDAFSPNTSV